MKSPLLRGLTVSLFAAASLAASAEEARTWTDIKGRKLDGVFLRQDETTVWVKRGDGREIAIAKKTLSPDDLKHLETAVPAPDASPSPSPAPATGASSAVASGRFATVKLDPTSFKPREGGFKIGTMTYASNLETEHFLIGGFEKTRPAVVAAYADALERLWIDVAADLPELAEAFKGRRMPIILADGEKEATAFAGWHEKHAEDSREVSSEYRLTTSSIATFSLDSAFAKENGFATSGRLFRLDSKNAQSSRRTWPERIHFVASDLFGQMTGKADENEDFNLSMVRLSFAYHREELCCGRIESEVTFGGGTEVEGFKNGRNWAGATKKLLKGGATPDIKGFLQASAAKAEPRDLGFGLGLMHMIQADPAKRSGFNKLIAETRKDDKCPTDEAFSKALGFDSPAAMNTAWKDYMVSDAFQ
ncbi:hypothetical protein [Haloferula sp. BvORR071]|uniref:hypothetical protein n=1 Tax=Haloferula sp. BvORR071 TaxID=1396141 RepID=UPI002240E8E6|nr:hypothetical protein [Haloferula sp. BvORR071]